MKLITTHINADFDAFASMVAVKKLHPGALPVFPGSCELKVKEFIQLYPEFAVHRLKEIKSDEVKELIVVDTAMPGRIGDLARFIGWKNIKVTVYDHHPVVGGEIKAEVMVKGVNGSPTGATISILVKELKEKNIPISPREATLFAIALYEETGFFSYLSTTQLEFDMMSHLLGCGANLNIIKDFLKEGFSPEQDILFGRLLASMESHEIKGIPVKIAFAETEQYVKDIALLVHKLREMGNLVVVFAVVKFSDRINIIARSSIEEVNVGEVVREFGGGGHGSAASATLREGGLVEVKERLLAVLERKIKPFLRAKDIMSSPVLSIKPDISCEESRKIMLRFNHSSLPIVSNNKLIGIVGITDLDKCMQHNFNDAEVCGYMKTNVLTVTPDTPVTDIQRLMIDENVGKVPVVQADGSVAGIVTRSDVLKNVNKERMSDKIQQIEKALENTSAEIAHTADILEERLPPRILGIFKTAGELADKLGMRAFLVGGFVRDLLLGIDNFDIDVVIEGDGLKYAAALAKKYKMKIKVHKKFGTAVLILEGKLKIDIATARVEFYDYPASAPQVEFSHIKYDLYRRDFTINTMAIELNAKEFGTLVDFFGGRRDLKNGEIRVLHNMSFVEDPTRIFRAIRFEQRYGMKMEESTRNFLANALELEMFERLATYKIKDEIVQILNEDHPIKALIRMQELDVLRYIHPSLKVTAKLKALFKEIYHSFSVEVLFVEEKVERWFTNFLVLLDELELKECQRICDRFKLDRDIMKKVVHVKAREEHILSALNPVKMKNSAVYKELYGTSIEGLLFYIAKSKSLRVRQRIHLYISTLSKVKVVLKGEDLKSLGINPGPVFYQLFSILLDAKLDGKAEDKSAELAYIKYLI